LPKSHSSEPSTTPSPHGSGRGSSTQIPLQPSPGSVLLSSQLSGETTRPSPQIGAQRRPNTGQCQPGSIAQSWEQPSPPTALPSSHASRVSSRPLPQNTGHGPPLPQTPHDSKHSIWQMGLQPSRGLLL